MTPDPTSHAMASSQGMEDLRRIEEMLARGARGMAPQPGDVAFLRALLEPGRLPPRASDLRAHLERLLADLTDPRWAA